MLELRAVRAAYGPIEVLHGVDLRGAAGHRSSPSSGPNGAGKTTLLKVIAGLHPVTDGDVIMAGRRVNGAAPDVAGPGRRCASSPRAGASSPTSPCASTCAWPPTPAVR